jgi:hypothetical protein
MYAVEFKTNLDRGPIKIPKQYVNQCVRPQSFIFNDKIK